MSAPPGTSPASERLRKLEAVCGVRECEGCPCLPSNPHGWPVWRAYRAANPGLGTGVVVEGGGHENLPEVVGFGEFADLVGRFGRGELAPSAE